MASHADASSSRDGRTAEATPAFSPKSPRSPHTSDPFLQAFLDPAFDPASYLNATLPPLALAPASTTKQGSGTGQGQAAGVPLAELSSQAQSLLLQLNTQTTRLSGTLTQLTDEILRSGSKLAYEVELLRGEALSLEEIMAERLHGEIGMFMPGGLTHKDKDKDKDKDKAVEEEDPAFIKQLQTLTLVRARLDSVIHVFGDAMEFVFPPSETSLSSGFLSVSAPEPGSEQQSSEEKGHRVLKALRGEIASLLYKSADGVQGVERAAERVQALKELATVWRGTAEEKGRAGFVDGLARMVEERHRELLRGAEQAKREREREGGRQGRGGKGGKGTTGSSGAAAAATTGEDGRTGPGFGLMSQLQKLRSGI